MGRQHGGSKTTGLIFSLILSYAILSYPILPSSALSYSVLSYPILSDCTLNHRYASLTRCTVFGSISTDTFCRLEMEMEAKRVKGVMEERRKRKGERYGKGRLKI